MGYSGPLWRMPRPLPRAIRQNCGVWPLKPDLKSTRYNRLHGKPPCADSAVACLLCVRPGAGGEAGRRFMPISFWIIFNAAILLLLFLDLAVANRKRQVIPFKRALLMSAFWIG